MNISISFLLFFGSLIGICLLMLHRSIIISRTGHDYHNEIFHLNPWYTPNLHKWKQVFYRIIGWFRDISLRYWVVWLIGQSKYILYKILRSLHRGLLGIIKVLEHHEETMKDRLRARGDLPHTAHAAQQRLISTLSKKKYPDKPINH